MFRGPSWDDLLVSRFADQRSEERRTAASHKWKIISSGASPGWLRQIPEGTCLLPAGRDRTFGHLPPRLAVAGSLKEAGTAVPIT